MEGEPVKQTILRGKLLALLKKVYPDGVDEKTVVSVHYQYHRTEDIAASLEYLVGKKYVERKEHPHPFLALEKVQWYKLTPEGIDLLEGNIPEDPGVLIERG
jgi:sugar (pentulose or hexulose) kinase